MLASSPEAITARTVVVASVTVLTNEGEDNYDALLLPVIRAAFDSGRLNDVDPAVVKVSYLAAPGETDNASAAESSGGMEDDTKIIVAASAGAVAFLALIVVATMFWRKKRLQSAVTAAKDTTSSPIRDAKPPSTVYSVQSEVYEWPDRTASQSVLSSQGHAEDATEGDIPTVLPTAQCTLINSSFVVEA